MPIPSSSSSSSSSSSFVLTQVTQVKKVKHHIHVHSVNWIIRSKTLTITQPNLNRPRPSTFSTLLNPGLLHSDHGFRFISLDPDTYLHTGIHTHVLHVSRRRWWFLHVFWIKSITVAYSICVSGSNFVKTRKGRSWDSQMWRRDCSCDTWQTVGFQGQKVKSKGHEEVSRQSVITQSRRSNQFQTLWDSSQ